jgi:hypothetical protein
MALTLLVAWIVWIILACRYAVLLVTLRAALDAIENVSAD